MNLIQVILLAVGLSMDAFAVSVAIGLGHKPDLKEVLRVGAAFGIFQAGMTIGGYFLGEVAEGFLDQFTHWVAFGLLALIGGKMLYEAIRGEEVPNPRKQKDPTRGMTLLMLAIATSIDALAAGLSLALVQDEIVAPGLLIGLITFALSLVGIRFGKKLGHKFEEIAEIAGGIVLLGIAANILIQHLW